MGLGGGDVRKKEAEALFTLLILGREERWV